MTPPNFYQKHCTPWWADIGDEAIVIRDRDGKAICAMPLDGVPQVRIDQTAGDLAATAQLLALAPELFASLHALLDVMRRSDAELAQSLGLPICYDNEWDDATDEAQALLDLLAEDGVTLGEPASPEGISSPVSAKGVRA